MKSSQGYTGSQTMAVSISCPSMDKLTQYLMPQPRPHQLTPLPMARLMARQGMTPLRPPPPTVMGMKSTVAQMGMLIPFTQMLVMTAFLQDWEATLFMQAAVMTPFTAVEGTTLFTAMLTPMKARSLRSLSQPQATRILSTASQSQPRMWLVERYPIRVFRMFRPVVLCLEPTARFLTAIATCLTRRHMMSRPV